MIIEKLERRYVDWSERAFAKAVSFRHRSAFPALAAPALQEIYEALQLHGIWAGDLERLRRLGVLETFDLDGVTEALDLIAQPGQSTSSFKLDDPRISSFYTAALTSGVYDEISRSIGEPALYLGAQVKREHPTGFTGAVRQWHKDTEDRAVMKLLIYSTDVGPDHGPFEYLPLAESAKLSERMGGSADYIPDADFERLTGGGRSVRATGPRGTALIFDGARLFHRARPPEAGVRDSVTYSFTSRQPNRVFQFQKPTPALRRLVRQLGPGMEERIPRLW